MFHRDRRQHLVIWSLWPSCDQIYYSWKTQTCVSDTYRSKICNLDNNQIRDLCSLETEQYSVEIWSIVSHLRSSWNPQLSVQQWSTNPPGNCEDFFSIFSRSEVGHLNHLVMFQFFKIVLISAVQNLGLWMDFNKSCTTGKINWSCLHLVDLILTQIKQWAPRREPTVQIWDAWALFFL